MYRTRNPSLNVMPLMNKKNQNATQNAYNQVPKPVAMR